MFFSAEIVFYDETDESEKTGYMLIPAGDFYEAVNTVMKYFGEDSVTSFSLSFITDDNALVVSGENKESFDDFLSHVIV